MAMAPPKRFVFMDYSNPIEDSKLLENRQKVAKYAMLGRKKDPSQTTKKPSQRRTSSPKKATSPDTGDEWHHVQQTLRGASTQASSLPSLTGSISSGVSTHSGSPTIQSGLPAFWSPNANTHLHSAPICPSFNRHDSGCDSRSLELQSAPLPDTDFYPFAKLQQGLYTQAAYAAQQDQSFGVDDNDTRLAARKRQSRQRHQQAKLRAGTQRLERGDNDCTALPNASYSSSSDVSARSPRRPGPRTLLSANSSDPFSCLPIKANAHTHELLYQYMNARLISSDLANGSPETFERMKRMRHTVWGPLTMKSKAALSALVAYVESTPGLPIKSRSKDFLLSHVAAALESIREALSKPDVATDDSICLAVVLLMLTAQREGSIETYAQHAAGLSTLLHFRTQAIQKLGEQHDTVQRLRNFCNSDPSDECNYCRTNGSPSRSSTPAALFQEAFIADAKSFNEDYFPRGEGFRDLVRQGILSDHMSSFIEPAMIWSTLAERARRDKLSAAIGATHAWIDEGEFSLTNMSHPVDTAVFTAVRLCFYLSSWLDWQHNCSAVRRLAQAVCTAVQETDIDHLLMQSPNVVIWLCLMAGPLCEDGTQFYFANLLDRARTLLGLDMLDFHGRIELFTHTYVWSATMTAMAQNFWNESFPFDPNDVFPSVDFELDSRNRLQEIW